MKFKKFLFSGLVITGLMLFAQIGCAADIMAVSTNQQLYFNGSRKYITKYNINGNNYFMLRDLAKALSDTPAKFDVIWNESQNSIELVLGEAYTDDSGIFSVAQYSGINAVTTTSDLIINGNVVNVTAYNIQGNNYYKLRDLSEYLPFKIIWNENKNSIYIYTVCSDSVITEADSDSFNRMTEYRSTSRWSKINYSYIYSDDDTAFTIVDASDDKITAYTYDYQSFDLIDKKEVPYELDMFGGFYAGEEYNYIVFGQNNEEEDDNKEVIRVVKYDKDFNRISSAKVSDCYTITPFDAGSLRMSENGDDLTVHTARLRYKTEDGLNHQSQLTIIINTQTMTVKNPLVRFQENHVSHSFNQFVKYDNGNLLLVDHGDAYPRSIVLHKLHGQTFEESNLFTIPGEIGANCTGVTLGGFEIGSKHYITAINTIDHRKVTEYDTFDMEGLDIDERDVVLLITPKNDMDNTKEVRLTDYIGKNKLASTPYIVKMDNGRFMILWEEFEYSENNGTTDNGVKYVIVDENGTCETSIQSKEDAYLSTDCQPLYINGKVIWYVNVNSYRIFFGI